MRKIVKILILLVISASGLFAQQINYNKLIGKYLGQKEPGITPELFAPGIISTNITEWTLTFTPNGLEAFYTIQGLKGYNHLICVKEVNGIWQQPEIASFSNPDRNADPFIAPDGQKLFFWSNGPADLTKKPENNSDIWYVERIGNSWGKPIRLDSTINTKHWQIFPTVSLSGNLYFSCNYPDSKGGFDIYKSEFIKGKYTKPENLSDSINTPHFEQEPYIAADESYIIFGSDRHAPGTQDWDLYISFRTRDGEWTTAINMCPTINTNAMEQAAIVTSDGKYLFFSSNRVREYKPGSKDFNYQTIINALNGCQNGNSDVYWVSAEIIEKLKDLK